MTKDDLKHSKLRKAVLQAAASFSPVSTLSEPGTIASVPGGVAVFTKAARKFTGPDSGLSEDEAHCLSAIVFLSAIKVMKSAGTLPVLGDGQSTTRARQVEASSLPLFLEQLFERFKYFCPAELIGALPAPATHDTSTYPYIWELLNDTSLQQHFLDESSLGFTYQYFCSPVRGESQKHLQTANKSLDLRRLIAFTQLYTPDWVIDFLLQNCLVSQWQGQSAKQLFPFFLGTDNEKKLAPACDLQMIDPACGSGHFLLKAFDLFVQLYKTEGIPANEAIPQLLSTNIAGADIDPVALWICALALFLKCLRYQPSISNVVPKLAHAQMLTSSSMLGSLSPHWETAPIHPLGQRYDCVATNPPYIGRKLLDRSLKAELKASYPLCHQDLCAAFLSKGLDLLKPGGRLGLIGQSTLMYLPTYSKFRQHLLEKHKLISIVEAGTGVFPLQGGEKVNSALYVIESASESNEHRDFPTKFFDLSNVKHKSAELQSLIFQTSSASFTSSASSSLPSPYNSSTSPTASFYSKKQSFFTGQRHYSFNYRCPPILIDLFKKCTTLGDIAEVRQGLATTDNERFVRLCWEVDPKEIGTRWFPYVKGAGTERWWAPINHVIDWKDNGAEIKAAVARAYPYLKGKTAWVVKNEQFYFRRGLTFSFVNSRALAVRKLPAGCIFDVAGSAIFADPDEEAFLLGYLNSSFIQCIARLFNPTINFQVGDLRALPILRLPKQSREVIASLSERCSELKKTALLHKSFHITSWTPAQSVMQGQAIETAFMTYSAELERVGGDLLSLEEAIDDIIEDHLLSEYAQGGKEVCLWMEKQPDCKKRLIDSPTSTDFARTILWQMLGSRVVVPHLISLKDDADLCQFLEMSTDTAQWISAQLKTQVHHFLANHFAGKSMNRLPGLPHHVCTFDADTEILRLIPQTHKQRQQKIQ